QEFLLDVMRKLRQGDMGRKRSFDDVPGKHPGRSYWPEPDAIRGALKVRSRDHEKRVTGVDAFPRASFGMPIVFHFKDDKQGDPPETTLVPRLNERDKPKGRLASPLILRPHRAADGVIEALAIALVHPAPPELVLVDKQKRVRAEVKKWTL